MDKQEDDISHCDIIVTIRNITCVLHIVVLAKTTTHSLFIFTVVYNP